MPRLYPLRPPCHALVSIHFIWTNGKLAPVGSLLQVRDVPDEVRRALKARAAARGESLNRYLLDLLEREAAQPTVREVLDRAAERAGRGGVPIADVLDAIRREREDELGHPHP